MAVDSVIVYYIVNDVEFSQQMDLNGMYTANLGSFNYDDTIKYWIVATDNLGNNASSDDTPLRIGPADIDNDGYTEDIDCDDNDENINPGMDDICNGIDDDCDAATEDGSSEEAPLNNLQEGVCFESTQSCIGGS